MLLLRIAADHLLGVLETVLQIPRERVVYELVVGDDVFRVFSEKLEALHAAVDAYVPKTHVKGVASAIDLLSEQLPRVREVARNPPEWLKRGLKTVAINYISNGFYSFSKLQQRGGRYFHGALQTSYEILSEDFYEKIVRIFPLTFNLVYYNGREYGFVFAPSEEEIDVLRNSCIIDPECKLPQHGSPLAYVASNHLLFSYLLRRHVSLDLDRGFARLLGIDLYLDGRGLLNLLNLLEDEEALSMVWAREIVEVLRKDLLIDSIDVEKVGRNIAVLSIRDVDKLLDASILNMLDLDRVTVVVEAPDSVDRYRFDRVTLSVNVYGGMISVRDPPGLLERLPLIDDIAKHVKKTSAILGSKLVKALPGIEAASELVKRGYEPNSWLSFMLSSVNASLQLVRKKDGKEIKVAFIYNLDDTVLVSFEAFLSSPEDAPGLVFSEDARRRIPTLVNELLSIVPSKNKDPLSITIGGRSVEIRGSFLINCGAATRDRLLGLVEKIEDILNEIEKQYMEKAAVEKEDSQAVAAAVAAYVDAIQWSSRSINGQELVKKIESTYGVDRRRLYSAILVALSRCCDYYLTRFLGGKINQKNIASAVNLLIHNYLSIDVEGDIQVGSEKLKDLLTRLGHTQEEAEHIEAKFWRRYILRSIVLSEFLEGLVTRHGKIPDKVAKMIYENMDMVRAYCSPYLSIDNYLKEVRGKPLWNYLQPELRRLLATMFWEQDAVKILLEKNLLEKFKDIEHILENRLITESNCDPGSSCSDTLTSLVAARHPETIGLRNPQQSHYIDQGDYIVQLLRIEKLDRDSHKKFAVFSKKNLIGAVVQARNIEEAVEKFKQKPLTPTRRGRTKPQKATIDDKVFLLIQEDDQEKQEEQLTA